MQEKKMQPERKVRSSNFELYRVIVMFLIVLHHFVANSGLNTLDGPIFANVWSFKSLFLLVAGAWGKTGINCFVMITGYFMCKSQITVKKFAKLLFEIMFYRIVIGAVFWLTGYAPFSWTELAKMLLPVYQIKSDFVSAFLVFFLCIPFLNILISHLNEKQHIYLLLLEGFLYVFLGTLPFFSVIINYVSWFAVVYFIASYIRLYPKKIFDHRKFWGWATAGCVAVSVCSVFACTLLSVWTGMNVPYYFVSDSNTFLAVCTALSSFLFVKNLQVPYSRLINALGASAFGVLLIHANSDTMRQWLWVDLLDCVGMYDTAWMPLYAIGCCLLIFAVCSIIDLLRIRFLERPVFSCWDKYESTWIQKYKTLEQRLCRLLHISNQ